jgi:hypothetical protein
LDPKEAALIRESFLSAARSGSWLEGCANLHDVTVVARTIIRKRVLTAAELDRVLAPNSYLVQLLAESRNPSTWILLLSLLKQRGMTQTLESIGRQGRKDAISLARMLLGAEAHQVASFLRLHPTGQAIIEAIALDEWAEIQLLHAPRITATEAVSAITYLEKQGRSDLARAPALAQVVDVNVSRWRNADIAHLSNVLRLAKAEEDQVERLLAALRDEGWLEATFKTTSIGALSAALLSLVNHLPEGALRLLPADAIEQRLAANLRGHAAAGGDPGARAICFLGAASEIYPTLTLPSDVSWPSAKMISQMISLRAERTPLNNWVRTKYSSGLALSEWKAFGPSRFSFLRCRGHACCGS